MPWHILAPSAVVYDILPLRASAHPAGGFLSYRKAISYTMKETALHHAGPPDHIILYLVINSALALLLFTFQFFFDLSLVFMYDQHILIPDFSETIDTGKQNLTAFHGGIKHALLIQLHQ